MKKQLACHRGALFVIPLLITLASAQGGTTGQSPPIVGGAPFLEAWVDPFSGADISGAVGVSNRPYRTLGVAIAQLATAGASAATPGLVHANPGIYSQATNGELLPITMLDGISVKGTDARSCVIRGAGNQVHPGGVFLPTANPACACGSRVPAEVLVDCSRWAAPPHEESIQRFTFQGGEVQVYAESKTQNVSGTVANCVFDMIDMHDALVGGPAFGILMVQRYIGPPQGYFDVEINVLNNTFVQTLIHGSGSTVTVYSAVLDNVAIANTTDPRCGLPGADPNPILRGIGSPNIQNNLIRCNTLLGLPRAATIGIDSTDTAAVVQGGVINTNVFDPALAGSMSAGGAFCVNAGASTPVAARNPNPGGGGLDPAFVGEYLSLTLAAPLLRSRDWRLLPGSPCAGAGIPPTSSGSLTAQNGTAYREPILLPHSAFLFDGEGYGNLRIQGGVDAGFDQVDAFIECGYGNDAKNTRGACFSLDPTPAGPGYEVKIFPTSGNVTVGRASVTAGPFGILTPPLPPFQYFSAYSAQFGSLVPPTVLPGFPSAPTTSSLFWLAGPSTLVNLSATIASFAVPAAPPYTPVGAGATGGPLVFGAIFGGFFAPATCSYVNEQAFFTPTGSPHHPSAGILSNLQSFRY